MKSIFNKYRPLSFSAISSFQYDKETWYRKYVLREKQETNAAMEMGKKIGSMISSDPAFLPEVPRYSVFEKELRGRINDIYLIGYLDSYDSDTHSFYEYKTSQNKTRWTQKTANEHDQLKMYAGLLYLNHGISPEKIKCKLISIPVRENGDFSLSVSDNPVEQFEVSFTVLDILNFFNKVDKIHKEMLQYVADKQVASTKLE